MKHIIPRLPEGDLWVVEGPIMEDGTIRIAWKRERKGWHGSYTVASLRRSVHNKLAFVEVHQEGKARNRKEEKARLLEGRNKLAFSELAEQVVAHNTKALT